MAYTLLFPSGIDSSFDDPPTPGKLFSVCSAPLGASTCSLSSYKFPSGLDSEMSGGLLSQFFEQLVRHRTEKITSKDFN